MEIMRNFNGENVRISLSAAEVREAYQEQIRTFNLSAALRAFYKHIGVDEASIDIHAPIDDFVKEDFRNSYGVALDDVLDPSSDYYIIPDIVESLKVNSALMRILIALGMIRSNMFLGFSPQRPRKRTMSSRLKSMHGFIIP